MNYIIDTVILSLSTMITLTIKYNITIDPPVHSCKIIVIGLQGRLLYIIDYFILLCNCI